MIESICVFCGSAVGKDSIYKEASEEFGRLLAKRNIWLVYGGARAGLMGKVADSTLYHGGKVVGIIPRFIAEKEIAHSGITELIETHTMHERKMLMFQRSDAFVALPGGIGTLDELCEMFTWQQLKIHRKPIGILNVNDYFSPLIEFFHYMTREGFLSPELLERVILASDPEELIERVVEKDVV